MNLTRNRLLEILDAIHTVRVGVIGDFNLDGYWYADMTRSQLSREAPLFPRPVVRETYSPGGAANVAWNLAELGLRDVRAYTLFGSDWRRDLLAGILTKLGVNLEPVVTWENWLTPFFGKVILTSGALQQEDARVDFTNAQQVPEWVQEEVFRRVSADVDNLDALIVADYAEHGLVSEVLAEKLVSLAIHNPRVRCVADSRDHIGSFAGMILKPNEVEAARCFLPGRDPSSVKIEELQAAALHWSTGHNQPVVITRGEAGCLVIEGGEIASIPAVRVPPPIDPVGAGDTFLASLTACLAGGASTVEACCVATLAAAVTVRCLRITGAASPEKILEQYDALNP